MNYGYQPPRYEPLPVYFVVVQTDRELLNHSGMQVLRILLAVAGTLDQYFSFYDQYVAPLQNVNGPPVQLMCFEREPKNPIQVKADETRQAGNKPEDMRAHDDRTVG